MLLVFDSNQMSSAWTDLISARMDLFQELLAEMLSQMLGFDMNVSKKFETKNGSVI